MDASDVKDELSSPAPAPAPVAKKRGRPPRSASRTPANVAVAKTPRSTKSTAAAPKSTGRKRKAESAEPESEAEQNRAKRGRPVRTTGVVASAKLAVWAAKAATRGKSTTTAKVGFTHSFSFRLSIPQRNTLIT
ncbi:hypothetical protein B0T25DRAFT_557881 [Lasiosphaeria hispida]|uniref:Uncharacterized protein n=1 Tax=Lasiosphaeria hispida TaxID=260671 RepID=A0AAJ0M803_9PEZI|nr:hypothetical protein B0T25DRAFT_557881 [Lasiosphaeria hispida]